MKKVILITFLFFIIGSSFAFGQRKMDVSLQTNRTKASRYLLEWRTKKNDAFYMKIGVSYRFSNRPHLGWYNGDIIAVNDSVVTKRAGYSFRRTVKLNLGFEKQIKSSIFYYGAGGSVGYLAYSKYFVSSKTKLSKTGEWNDYYEMDESERNTSSTFRSFVVPGIHGSISMNLPVGERFLVTLSLNPYIDFNIPTGYERTKDPFNEFREREVLFVRVGNNSGFGIRYRLGKVKE